MSDNPMLTPDLDGRNASTLELFFDLVYVFAITQVVAVIHHDFSPTGLASGALLLWLLWWTWSVYTWTTNWTGTDGTAVRLFILAAMGATLFMAMAVPDAFGDGALWFGVAYFVVRVLAAAFYWVAAPPGSDQRRAFLTFAPMSLVAAGLILAGGILGTPLLWWFWIAGAALDIVSAANSGKGTWSIDTNHFAERNGLFIIIALGESIVGIGLTAAGVERDFVHTTAIGIAFVIAAGLWWSYFDKTSPFAERHLTSLDSRGRALFARDGYSIMLYPLVVGIVFFAVAAEDIVAHPSDPLEATVRFALGGGVAFVLLTMGLVIYRIDRSVVFERVAAAAALAVIIVVGGGIEARWFAAAVAAVLVASLVWEHTHTWQSNPEPAAVDR